MVQTHDLLITRSAFYHKLQRRWPVQLVQKESHYIKQKCLLANTLQFQFEHLQRENLLLKILLKMNGWRNHGFNLDARNRELALNRAHLVQL